MKSKAKKPLPPKAETRVIYVTKWWETKGLLQVLAEVRPSGYAYSGAVGMSLRQQYQPNQWYGTIEGARERIEALRKRRIATLKKQLAKLQQLNVQDMKVKDQEES